MRPHHSAAYVRAVIEAYRRLPGARGQVRPADRRLAATLCRQGVPLQTVHAAMLVACARHAARPPDAEPLPPIGSLHYLRPVIEEITDLPLAEGYTDYLKHLLARMAPDLITAIGHRIP